MGGRLRGAYFTVWSICSFLGGLLTVLLVRGFFFNDTDEAVWNVFWNWALHGGMINMEMFLRSATFAKSMSGFVLGGLLVGAAFFVVACLIWD